MGRLNRQDLVFLLKQAGIDPDDKDLEDFQPLIEKYMEALRLLHSVDSSGEEIAPTFNPQWKLK